MRATGYLAPGFGLSYREVGPIVRLPRSGVPLIRRAIDGDRFDLVGAYPYTMCADWRVLAEEVDALAAGGAVSVVLVSDPFATEATIEALAAWSLCRPFKSHYVVDLRGDWRAARSETARRYARRALEVQDVAVVEGSATYADVFWAMYRNTIERHRLTGIQRLSRDIVARQLAVDGAVLSVARDAEGVAGALLSYDHGLTANGHLLALSERAYEARTTYALYEATLSAFEARGCRYYNLGGAAGARDDPEDGLAQFKRRWTGETRMAMLCGTILDADAAAALRAESGVVETGYFPHYRAPEGRFAWRP